MLRRMMMAAVTGVPGTVAALLHFNGSDGSTSFTDVTGKAWTAVGAAQIDTAQSKFGSASGLFDGTTAYITTPSHTDFGFGTGDYTVEGFARPSAAATNCMFDNRTASLQGLAIYSHTVTGGTFDFVVATNSAILVHGTTPFSTTSFTHWAVCRQGTTIRLYLDGVQVGSATDARTLASSNPVVIGANYAAAQFYQGWIDEVRIVKGACLYPNGTTFTPPSSPFPNP